MARNFRLETEILVILNRKRNTKYILKKKN